MNFYVLYNEVVNILDKKDIHITNPTLETSLHLWI